MLTPLDIQNKEFSREFRGYSMSEVDEFLNLVIDGYEKLYRENMESKNEITKLKEQVGQYKELENTLQSTLVVAQSASEQVQKNAEEKAENIIADANNKAKEIVAKSFDDVKQLEYRYEDLKRGIDIYRAKMTALLHSQLGLLEKVETSDETVKILGMKEAISEVEETEREIKIQRENYEENPEPNGDETENPVPAHDFNTKEIEYLLNADE